MIKRVQARAYANIALCKYWGKLPGRGNFPATPSISLALDKLVTDTIVTALPQGPDRFILDHKKADQKSLAKLSAYLDLWRSRKFVRGYFKIESENSFPTGAGLASSASGYAALTLALSGFAHKKISISQLSRLSRQGSGSSARSVTGGLSKLPSGKNPSSQLIRSPEDIPWGMVVAVVDCGKKEVGSTQGMEFSRTNSPYYKSWLMQAAKDYRSMLAAIRTMDFTRIGEICESNTLAMHACMIATRPSLIYWNEVTVFLISMAAMMRKKGLEAYCSIDAGPHVAFLTKREDFLKVKRRISKVFGVKSALVCYPAGDAKIIDRDYD